MEKTPDPILELRRFDRARKQAAFQLFQDLPLQDPAQHYLMECIRCCMGSDKAPSQRDLAKKMERSPATVTASLKALEKHGLVRRYPDEIDQRINRVELTESGMEMSLDCRQRFARLDAAMFQDFTGEELIQLSTLFEKIVNNISDLHLPEKEEPTLD